MQTRTPNRNLREERTGEHLYTHYQKSEVKKKIHSRFKRTMAKKTETGRINTCDHTTNAGGTATVTRTAWNPRQKTLVFTAGLVLLLQLLSIFLPPFPCSWTESRWDARTAPTLPASTPQPRAQAQIEAHTWRAAYQISGAGAGAMGWKKGRRGLGREEQERRRETNRSAPQESKPARAPGFPFLFSPLRSHQLAFSFPPRQLEQGREEDGCLGLTRLPPGSSTHTRGHSSRCQV